MNARTLKNIATLDPRCQQAFMRFASLAQAEAEKHGCDYIMICGNRTWAQQNELHSHGRSAPGPKVTNARGGYSNHNFGIAADFGVFKGKVYMDETNPKIADTVHRACAAHAMECGLDWGGHWDAFPDYPHYEAHTVLSMTQKRERYGKTGTVLA